MIPKRIPINLLTLLICLTLTSQTMPQETDPLYESVDMSAYYTITTIPIPEGLIFEPGGMDLLPDGRLAVATRYGQIFFLDGIYDNPPRNVTYHEYAKGLHEPLGLVIRNNDLFVAQRTEVTRLRDTDRDDIANQYLTYAKGWGVSGNYHEYAFGPVFDSKGNAYVTLNINIGKGYRPNDLDWRGWSMKITPDGKLHPYSAGLRSPSGILIYEDELFFTDQQGNYVGTSTLMHAAQGDFHGHADSLRSVNLKGATVSKPQKMALGVPMVEAKMNMPQLKPPAVWFPYKKTGMGQTGMVNITDDRFGPFKGQILVGDFTMSNISRVSLEKVNGVYQGVVIPFLDGFDAAVLRLTFGKDGSLFVGQTNRGWNSLGTKSYALQRVNYTGRLPFEIKTIRAEKDGFTIYFTKPVNPEAATQIDNYKLISYTYLYQQRYGSDEVNKETVKIERITHNDANHSVRVHLAANPGLRKGYVHEFSLDNLTSSDTNEPLLHRKAYYTLNAIPLE